MGEFNVNKSDGSLEQTAGMPDTYPAEQVMMSDGVTSVEDAADELTSGLNNAKNIMVTGHIPVDGGYAIWNTTGIELTNRYPVAFYVYNGGEPFFVSQGVTGFSVGMNSVSHVPIIFLGSDADAGWKNQDCFAVYAKVD